MLLRKAAVCRKLDRTDRSPRAKPRGTDEEFLCECSDDGAQGFLRRVLPKEEQRVTAADIAHTRRDRELCPLRFIDILPCIGIQLILSKDLTHNGQQYVIKNTFNDVGCADVRFEPIACKDIVLDGARIKEYRLIFHCTASFVAQT